MAWPFHSSHPSRKSGAFTLVELMVATAVLILLVVMVTQLTNSAATVTTGSRKHMDADSQARMIFDRMANDFSRMPKRTDMDCIFSNQATNDAMFYYSEAPAYYDGSASDFTNRNTTALIGYRINSAYQLERLGKLLTWDTSATSATPGSVVFLTYPPTASSPSPTASPTPWPASTLTGNWGAAIGSPVGSGTDADYHVIGDQVFRMAFCYLLKPYTVSGTTYPGFYSVNPYNNLIPVHAGGTTTGTVTGTFQGTGQGTGLQDVEAIIVAIAILDDVSRKIVPTTVSGSSIPNLGGLVSKFPDPTPFDLQTPVTATSTPPTPILMAQNWLASMNTSGFAATAGIPQSAAAQIRIYQRSFYLNK